MSFNRNILQDFWAQIKGKLGSLAAFIPTILDSIKIALKAGDAEKILAHAKELDEFADSLKALAAGMRTTVGPDGKLLAGAIPEVLTLIEAAIDEGEDVITGVDEDD